MGSFRVLGTLRGGPQWPPKEVSPFIHTPATKLYPARYLNLNFGEPHQGVVFVIAAAATNAAADVATAAGAAVATVVAWCGCCGV